LAKSQLEQMVEGGLKIGKDVAILNDVIIDPSHYWHISIGDEVTIAPRVHILAHDASTKRILGYTRIGKVHIGNRVFIGTGSIILPGVTIGDNSIVGAGSVVTRNIAAGTIVAGNPAKAIGTTERFTERRSREMQSCPVFEAEYTVGGGVTLEKKKEMNDAMSDGIAYIR
jgi:maltose O-acetyltransferase